ncbi:MAG TPA: branched-chain amino acid ABC transporter permease [Actinomycetota bacterium]|nr:branched-chain amino acid ABC transporter permease [Actinomycetota bacterium]
MSDDRPFGARAWLYGGAAAALSCFPLVVGDPFWLSVGTLTMLAALGAVGMVVILGYGGYVALGQVAFGGVAAYATTILQERAGIPLALAVVVATAGAMAVAALTGVALLRLRGIYFAAATFALAELARLVALNWTPVTNGQIGMVVPAEGRARLPGATVLEGVLIPAAADYYVALASFAAAAAVTVVYGRSRDGRALVALRDNERVAQTAGIRPTATRVGAFVLAAALAAVWGVMVARFNGLVDPQSMGVERTVLLLTIAIVGGARSVLGALVGAAVVTVVPEVLQVAVAYRPLLYGALLVVFATRAPEGVAGWVERAVRRRRARAAPVAAAAAPARERGAA